MDLRKSQFFIPLVLLLFLNCRVECLFIIPSMLMAMGGGLLMGKMTMGGLLMMLMAANQQQSGQNFLRNLGIIPHPAPSTGISVPTLGSSGGDFQDLIVRKRRDVYFNGSGHSSESFRFTARRKNHRHLVVDEQTQYRIMRQVASSDPLSCLPKALCGISATPPSSQSGFLNDYAYLLKTVFTRDEDVDGLDKDFDDLKYVKETKNSSTAAKKSKPKKKPENDEDQSEEESDEVSDETIAKYKKKDAIEMEDLANEEVVNHDPDYFSYALRDSMKKKPGYGLPLERPEPPIGPPKPPEYMGDIYQMSDSELDEMLSKLGEGPPPSSSGSLLSKLLPKLSMGLSPGKDQKFDDDPFFSGFKRNMERRSLEVKSVNLRPATSEEEKLFQEMRLKRKQRRVYIAQKRKELAEIQDPVEKYRIAAEFGQKLKSPRQCRLLFNNCPFNYTQVLGMVSDMRKVILGQPLNEPQKDIVVDLKPSAPAPPTNVINLNAGSGSTGGVTSILHELPTGEKVEISLRMTKNGVKQVTKKTPSPNSGTPSSATLVASSKSKNTGNVNKEDLFDEDNQENSDAGLKPIKNIESLKATMIAIQKINNVTIQRKKDGKPLSYSHVLADIKAETKLPSQGIAVFESITPKVTTKPVQIQKLKLPKNNPNIQQSNSPQNTAILLASTLSNTKVEDDEEDDYLGIGGVKRTSSLGPKTNEELTEILNRLKAKKKLKPNQSKKSTYEKENTEEEEESTEDDEDQDDEEEDEMDDLNSAYKYDRIQNQEETENVPLKGKKRVMQNRQRQTSKAKVKKPRKLFLGHDISQPRTIPL